MKKKNFKIAIASILGIEVESNELESFINKMGLPKFMRRVSPDCRFRRGTIQYIKKIEIGDNKIVLAIHFCDIFNYKQGVDGLDETWNDRVQMFVIDLKCKEMLEKHVHAGVKNTPEAKLILSYDEVEKTVTFGVFAEHCKKVKISDL